MRIAFNTLGCKINQYETDVMRQDLVSCGNTIVPFDSEADVYIINTCSVTAKSDYQCRQAIRSAARRANGGTVVVTGCYAETRPDEIKNIPGVDIVIGNREKTTITERIIKQVHRPAGNRPAAITTKSVQGRTRSFLKMQDGCDNACSYCIVPAARGKSRSADVQQVVKEFERLVSINCPEVVLTGIHIGAYGSDLSERQSLSDLISELISRQQGTRIRLSSIEPNEVTEGIIGFLGRGLCRHLHVPLQSGDDFILKAMNRKYTSGFYLELLESISEQVPGVALGADVMVGFPGEGEKEFQNTLELIERSPLTHLHVFSYSKRPGTAAAAMPSQVPEPVKKMRSEMLRETGTRKNLEFRKKQVGSELKAVVEDKKGAGSLLIGLTDNYIKVSISGVKEDVIGKEINVRLEKADETGNLAVLI